MTSIGGSNPFKTGGNIAQFKPHSQPQQVKPPSGENSEYSLLSRDFKSQMSHILGHQTDFNA